MGSQLPGLLLVGNGGSEEKAVPECQLIILFMLCWIRACTFEKCTRRAGGYIGMGGSSGGGGVGQAAEPTTFIHVVNLLASCNTDMINITVKLFSC